LDNREFPLQAGVVYRTPGWKKVDPDVAPRKWARGEYQCITR
jgi:hypothetical protein